MSSSVFLGAVSVTLFLLGMGLLLWWLAWGDRIRKKLHGAWIGGDPMHRRNERRWTSLVSQEWSRGSAEPQRKHKLDIAAFILLFFDTIVAFTGLVLAFSGA
jgi:hypothetical protein